MAVGIGASELVVVMLLGSGGLFGGGLLGMPPGERDPKFVQAVPADALVYSEWAARSLGKAGAQGLDGLAGDPEIREFVAVLRTAILTAVERETAGGNPKDQVAGRVVPALVEILLMRPGAAFVRFEHSRFEEGNGPQGLPAALQGALVINAQDDADRLEKLVVELLTLAPPEARTEKLDRHRLPVPNATLHLHRQGTHFVLAFGEGTLDAVLAGLAGKEPKPLGARAEFQAAAKRTACERTGAVTWIDVVGIRRAAAKVVGLQQAAGVEVVVKTLGLDGVESVFSQTGLDRGQVATRTLLKTDGRTEGVLSLAAGRALGPKDFEGVPADADLVAGISLAPEKLLAALRGILGQLAPPAARNLEAGIKAFEAETSLSLEKDVLKAFGDAWVLHDAPSEGGWFATSLVLSLEVKDARAALTVVDALSDVLRRNLPAPQAGDPRPRGVVLTEHRFLDRTIRFVNTIGDDVPVAPAFCLTDRHLLFALHPQPLKAHLRYLQSGEPNFSDRVARTAGAGGDVIGLSHCDAKSLVRAVYAAAPWLGQLACSELQRNGFPLDAFAVPSARAILPYVDDAVAVTRRTPEGLLFESRGGLPLPGAGTMLLQVPVMFARLASVRRAEAIRQIEIEVRPAEPQRVRPEPGAALRRELRLQAPVIEVEGEVEAVPVDDLQPKRRLRTIEAVDPEAAVPLAPGGARLELADPQIREGIVPLPPGKVGDGAGAAGLFGPGLLRRNLPAKKPEPAATKPAPASTKPAPAVKKPATKPAGETVPPAAAP